MQRQNEWYRRSLLKLLPAGLLTGSVAGLPTFGQESARPGVLSGSGIRLFNVREYGAAGQGRTLDTAAIQKAVDACFDAGGGTVYLPPGDYLSGTVVLKSNVTLYLESGATLRGSKNLDDYILQKGMPLKGDINKRHLIFAREATNVGIAGYGRIDGQGASFWIPRQRGDVPPDSRWRDVEIFDWWPLDRPSPLLEFVSCRGVHVEDVQIENSPGWTFRPLACDSVLIRGITIRNPHFGPNTDGIDVTCCRDVLISDCNISTGDDAICLKSDNSYGLKRLSKNIAVTNCILTTACNGFKIGTDTRDGFENIAFTNSVIYSESTDQKYQVISALAIEVVDGGHIDGLTISNIAIQNVRTPIFIRLGNRGKGQKNPTPGTLRNVRIDQVVATGASVTSSITGQPGHDVEHVNLSNIRIETHEHGLLDWVTRDVPEVPKDYPEARMFGRLPAYGLYCRHVNAVKMNNVELAAESDQRPALIFDDVKNLEIEGCATAAPESHEPVIRMKQVQRAFLRGCYAPPRTGTFLAVAGDRSGKITIMGNDFSEASRAIEPEAGVNPNAVFESGNRMPNS